MKHVLTRIIRTGWNGWARHRVLVASRESLPLEVLVSEITGERNPVFALSLGNQPAVRKLTVQAMRPDGNILGYVKLPLTDCAAERVRHEGMILERLWNSPALRRHIPRLLHAGVWGESYALFQTAVPGRLGPLTVTRMHDEFLRVLWSVHRVDKPVRILIEEIGAKWEKAALRLSDEWKALGQEVLRYSAQDLDQPTIPCGVSHGDFAPWNTRMHQDRLFLFDWESTNWEAPMSWDTFHFNLQTAVSLQKHIGSNVNSDHKSNHGTPYLLYLLSSVIQFLQEENWGAIDVRQQLLLRQFDGTVDVRSDIRVSREPAVQFAEGQPGREACHAAIKSISKVEGNPRIVTTSWDDGDPHDIRVAELLRSRGLPGTFYIPMSGYLGRKTLTPADVRSFSSEGFEIGAHSVSHNSLTRLTRRQLEHEVNTCKHILEQQIGREVSMFCYPNGRYNENVMRQVKRAGYQGARTTRMLTLTTRFGAFEMPTTLHVHPHAKFAYVRNLARARSLGGLCEFLGRFSRVDSWVRLGKSLFDLVVQEGGVWHLYGHSWLIEELRMWPDLHEMLDYVANREGVTYVTNGQLVQMMTPTRLVSATEAECEIARV
jgi:peptidoglycan-N-acetylglucosamine deacetylase